MISPDSTAEGPTVELTVVVTCYNEAEFISATLENVTAALTEVGRSYEIIVIDDASRDQSVAKIREFIRDHPEFPIHLKVNTRNRGWANNFVEGAFLGRGKYYRLCCGDDSEAKEVLVNVYRHIGRADMIIPYQLQKGVAGKSRVRRLVSVGFTGLVNLISGYRIKYYNGMAVHLRYNVMRWHPTSYGFGFQAETITRLLDEGASYLQVPSTSVHRKGSASSALTLRNFLSVCHTLLELAIRRVRKILYERHTKPVEIFLETAPHPPRPSPTPRP